MGCSCKFKSPYKKGAVAYQDMPVDVHPGIRGTHLYIIQMSEAQKGRVWKYIQSGNGENARGFHHAAVVEPFDFVFVCNCYIFSCSS